MILPACQVIGLTLLISLMTTAGISLPNSLTWTSYISGGIAGGIDLRCSPSEDCTIPEDQTPLTITLTNVGADPIIGGVLTTFDMTAINGTNFISEETSVDILVPGEQLSIGIIILRDNVVTGPLNFQIFFTDALGTTTEIVATILDADGGGGSDPCIPDPCNGQGICVAQTGGGYSCICNPGWTGSNCENDIDECSTGSPCSPFEFCLNNPGSYTCEPASDPCSPNPCANGICTPSDGGYSCSCSAGWNGANCDIDIDECSTGSPCSPFEFCLNNPGSYTCEPASDPCSPNPCVNGICTPSDGGYSCSCSVGWLGANCEIVDECVSSPCKNGATCDSTTGSYYCICESGWTGEDCDIDVDECLSSPCAVTEVCQNTPGSYNCDPASDPCSPNPCANGICTPSDGSYSCSCIVGWNGANCDIVDECVSSPCKNGATCDSTTGSYYCICQSGWTGEDCDIDIDECLSSPCAITEVCQNTPGSYNCDPAPDPCSPNPCANGICTPSDGSYSCSCSDGWTGANCEIVDECVSSPCKNGATCDSTTGSYSCACTSGWTGEDCDIDVDECTESPCTLPSVCVNTNGSYECINPCDPDPCNGNGICLDLQTGGGYSCICNPGWTGSNCGNDIDECFVNDPCDATEVCENTVGSYNCTAVHCLNGDGSITLNGTFVSYNVSDGGVCERCYCENAEIYCTTVYSCSSATCKVTGDPHYKTFDGKQYAFMGNCSYVMIQDETTNKFRITAENAPCRPRSRCPLQRHKTCITSVTIELLESATIVTMYRNLSVSVNGTTTGLPINLAPALIMDLASPPKIKATLENGVKVLWCGSTMKIQVWQLLETRGLCGSFDGIPDNDFTLPDGTIVTNADDFGNSWATEGCSGN